MIFLKMLLRLVTRSMVALTVFVLALATTTAGAALWYAAHIPSPLYEWQDSHPRFLFAGCMLMLICPWWALLAVMFRKLNWLKTLPRT